MTVIDLPSGTSVDFEGASEEQIEQTLMLMQKEQPELFEEPKITEEETKPLLTGNLSERLKEALDLLQNPMYPMYL